MEMILGLYDGKSSMRKLRESNMGKLSLLYGRIHNQSVTRKRILGTILIVVGFISLVTPLTPFAWLSFVGLELLGFHFAVWDKIKEKLLK